MEETGVDYASPGRRSIGNTQEKDEKKLNKRGCPFPQLLLFFLAFTCLLHFSCVIKRRQIPMLYKLFLQLIYFKLPCAALSWPLLKGPLNHYSQIFFWSFK